jgi:hypothetical protein
VANAQFGIGRRQQEAAGEEELIDLQDSGLIEAMEMFANMSPEEMEETMMELQQMLGDDPETMAAIQQVIEEIPNMKTGDVQSSLEIMVAEDELQAATNDALKMLQSSEHAWESIWEQRDQLLDAVLATGKIAPMDAARFQADPKEWEAELKHIYQELQKQAATAEKIR